MIAPHTYPQPKLAESDLDRVFAVDKDLPDLAAAVDVARRRLYTAAAREALEKGLHPYDGWRFRVWTDLDGEHFVLRGIWGLTGEPRCRSCGNPDCASEPHGGERLCEPCWLMLLWIKGWHFAGRREGRAF